MKEVESTHPAGTVGVLVSSLARYLAVFISLEKLKVPKGTVLLYAQGADIGKNANLLVDKMTGDWLWIMGDDHRFDADILMRLLDRKVEIVAPVVCMRSVPFAPVFYKKAIPGGHDNVAYTWPMLTKEAPQGGLLAVDAAGSAGMLVRRWVFESMTKPWFEYTKHTSEDINFCVNARAAGYTVNVDLDQTMTHITPCDLLPTRDEQGKWRVMIDVNGKHAAFLPEEAP